MKQLKTWSQFGFSSDVLGRYLLEVRPAHAILLHGFRIGLANARDANFKDQGDNSEGHAFLMAAPRAPLTPVGLGAVSLDGFVNNRGVIGYYRRAIVVDGPTNASVAFYFSDYQDWTPCGFLVPGLWLVLSNSQSTSVKAMDVTIQVLYESVKMTSIQLAALHTTYGMDPQDFDRKEASGNIDFSLAPGGAPIAGGVIG